LFAQTVGRGLDIFYFYIVKMRPDYPHKLFSDFRNHFFLLMETLAMGSRTSSHRIVGAGLKAR